MTKNQLTLVQRLEPLGYKAQGYDDKGSLVVMHPEAGTLAIQTHLRQRSVINVLIEAKRRLRFARSQHGKFLVHLYEKYDIKPGETATLAVNLQEELRRYLDKSGVVYDRRQFHSVYESVRRNAKCLQRGTNSLWEIGRPADPVIQKPYANGTLSAASAPLAPVAPKGTPLPLIVGSAPTRPEGAPTGTMALSSRLSPTVVSELRRALEMPDEHERLAIAQMTATQLADRIESEARYVAAELRALASLLEG